jgi:hypothetical protein
LFSEEVQRIAQGGLKAYCRLREPGVVGIRAVWVAQAAKPLLSHVGSTPGCQSAVAIAEARQMTEGGDEEGCMQKVTEAKSLIRGD